MRAYEAKRWARGGLVGALVQWDNAVVCAVRNGVLISRLVRLGFLFVF
jgi:hypothetical protein